MTRHHRPLALVTGGSAGLGHALVHALHDRGWTVVTDGRDAARLAEATRDLDNVAAIPGDIADPDHRAELVDAVRRLSEPDATPGASTCSCTTPAPSARSRCRPWRTSRPRASRPSGTPTPALRTPSRASLVDDLAAADGILLSLSSDAAVQHYPGWGGYGAAKAALDHLTLTFGEETGVTAYAVDPGDMNTQLHRDAEPGEDLSAPARLPRTWSRTCWRCSTSARTSGRYRAADVALDDR